MNSLNQLGKTLDEYYAKLPALPKGVNDFIVSVAPWLALIFGVLAILSGIAAFGILSAFSPVAVVAGVGGFAITSILESVVLFSLQQLAETIIHIIKRLFVNLTVIIS